MKYAILVRSAPAVSQAPTTAVHFARAAMAAGHEIVRIFFYQAGVLNALNTLCPAQDDALLPKAWHELAESGTELMVCAASAARHGVLGADEAKRYGHPHPTLDEAHFVVGGLGSWVEAVQLVDRVLVFGDGR